MGSDCPVAAFLSLGVVVARADDKSPVCRLLGGKNGVPAALPDELAAYGSKKSARSLATAGRKKHGMDESPYTPPSQPSQD